MKRAPGILVVAALLFPLSLKGQQRSPEVERLADWIGDWTYTISSQESTGSWSFEWFGNRMVRAEEHTPNGNDVFHMMAFDPEEGVYTWRRYWSSGLVDLGRGWLHENTWTFLFLEEPGDIWRIAMSFESPDVLTFRWEQMVEGGSWELVSEGRTTRIE